MSTNGNGTKQYTVKQIAEALRQTRGIMSAAADLIGCDRHTVERYVHGSPTLIEIRNQAKQRLVDTAEVQLMNEVNKGNWKAVRFVLERLGQDRGYRETMRQEWTGKDGAPVRFTLDIGDKEPDSPDDDA